jgi:uncharacterized protein
MAFPVDIRGVEEALAKQLVVTGALQVADLALGDQHFDLLTPAEFTVELTHTGAGIVASGTIRARATTKCARCLCEFEIDLVGDVEGFYVHPERDQGLPEEQDVEHIAHDRIDLESALVQALIVDLPFAPLHAPDCAGICPVCGADRNVEGCACVATDEASPFERLKELLPPENSAAGEDET